MKDGHPMEIVMISSILTLLDVGLFQGAIMAGEAVTVAFIIPVLAVEAVALSYYFGYLQDYLKRRKTVS